MDTGWLAPFLALAVLLPGPHFFSWAGQAAEPPPVRKPRLVSWFGETPRIDGRLDRHEWRDATQFEGGREWVPEFSPVVSSRDLALRGWVKHNREHLFFAFEIRDDVLYGIHTSRWLPQENARAHELTREGFPWFGDEMELLLNGSNHWKGDEGVDGDGGSWQMVCNLTKSRRFGLAEGGLLEGEPRSSPEAWAVYQQWILSGAQTAAVQVTPRGYVIEWAVRFNPCVELAPGRFYSPAQGRGVVGLNIAVGDLDRREQGGTNFGGFHHEQWWAGAPQTRTQKNNFGTLHLMGMGRRP